MDQCLVSAGLEEFDEIIGKRPPPVLLLSREGRHSSAICSFKSRPDHHTAATDTVVERDSSIGKGLLECTNIADDFKNDALGSLVTQLKSMVASMGKEE